MMNMQNGAAQYRAVRSHGLIADAKPTRLIQISFEHTLAALAISQGCMERISGNLPLAEVIAKGNAIAKAVRLIGHLNDCLDMEKGGQVAQNLRKLYLYMLDRLTLANATDDARIVVEVSGLVRKIKDAWDQIVAEGR